MSRTSTKSPAKESQETLKAQAYQSIRSALIHRRLQADQVFSEQWLADSLGISRTPVREALLLLRSEGLVRILPNRGMAVQPHTVEDARNIFQMRMAIDGFCSGYLAMHAGTAEGFAALERIEQTMHRFRETLSAEDELFIHLETIRFSRNPLFSEQFNHLRSRLDLFWWDVMHRPERYNEVHFEHRLILERMKAGDEQGAYKAAIRHNQITLEKLSASYKEDTLPLHSTDLSPEEGRILLGLAEKEETPLKDSQSHGPETAMQ